MGLEDRLKREITSKRDTWIISITGRKELSIKTGSGKTYFLEETD